jgi:hypothetical protein
MSHRQEETGMYAQDLKELTLAIVTGEKTDASQIEHNVAASYVRELVSGSSEWLDALYDETELHIVAKEIDGELFVLASDRKSFYAFDTNAGEPWIVPDLRFHDLNALLEELDDSDAKVMPLEEAMSFVNDGPRP